MRNVWFFAAVVLATLVLASRAWAEQPYGAVVVYGAPLESGSRPGASFIAASQADVIDLAVERCKANTITEQWDNCRPGRWIDTGRYLLVAAVCDATDDQGGTHRLLEFMRDGVTAGDDDITAAVRRETPYAIADGGCRKVAMFDATRPELSNEEEPGFARSVAKTALPTAAAVGMLHGRRLLFQREAH
ncbi:exported protein of unknown function [Beijerinckiaceae bacterium RH AL1]|nr:hypothetical protein [Beijerinckiaceae bacterium]VVB47878.1 exported protein of unknown function [Beijerinckiaceae bacterium RH CH11]VVB47956.1 exported protein of unknown function [Beijerinckiaceae bacterium RH AL8]VVC56111.1 exported protein of unknown function [Beijerinckiaceae bacterium RH AL1]